MPSRGRPDGLGVGGSGDHFIWACLSLDEIGTAFPTLWVQDPFNLCIYKTEASQVRPASSSPRTVVSDKPAPEEGMASSEPSLHLIG